MDYGKNSSSGMGAGCANQNQASPDSTKDYCIAREQTARERLERYALELHDEIIRVDALLKALPLELPYMADKALRNLLSDAGWEIR